MSRIWLFLIFITTVGFSQSELDFELIDRSSLDVDRLIEIDNFKTIYYLKDNILYKKGSGAEINYSNVQLGQISSVDILNPLKMNLFYSELNTVVILDNRLAEITKVDFNTVSPFRLVSHVSSGNDNNIWIFNQNTNQLELFDFINRKTKVTTLPLQGEVIDICSNFYGCWVLTSDYIYGYNYIGSLMYKEANSGFTQIEEQNENFLLLKENSLFYLPKDQKEISSISLPELLISRFFVTDETLYLYDGEILHQYLIKSN